MPTRNKTAFTTSARDVLERLQRAYPDAHCELDHRNPFELLVSTVLSAQTTDVAVNRITPELFRRWPTAGSMAAADPTEIEKVIGSIGMYRQKARNLVGLANMLVEKHRGEVPTRLEDLVALPGVGRKTANVVLGVAFGAPEGVVVDTHVQRIAQRLGFSRQTQPEPIEADLMALFPREQWENLPHTLIFHGRRCCTARAPACAACPVADACPSAFHAEAIGRKSSPRGTSPRAASKAPAKVSSATHSGRKGVSAATPAATSRSAPLKARTPAATSRSAPLKARTPAATSRSAPSKAEVTHRKPTKTPRG